MSLRLSIAACLFAFGGLAFAQDVNDEPGDRFVIPPDAMSTLRRDENSRPRVPRTEPTDTIPEILRDESALPVAVRETRSRILDLARKGDLQALRPLIGAGDQATQLSLDTLETDPIEFLLAASGDEAGHEVLAILIEVLEAGFVRIEDAEDGVLYVWPYFAAYPVDRLTPPMRVELFRLLTGGDFEEMQEFGAYVFYRVGISEDGAWRFFLSGDG